jgi:hypothetical protein
LREARAASGPRPRSPAGHACGGLREPGRAGRGGFESRATFYGRAWRLHTPKDKAPNAPTDPGVEASCAAQRSRAGMRCARAGTTCTAAAALGSRDEVCCSASAYLAYLRNRPWRVRDSCAVAPGGEGLGAVSAREARREEGEEQKAQRHGVVARASTACEGTHAAQRHVHDTRRTWGNAITSARAKSACHRTTPPCRRGAKGGSARRHPGPPAG